MAKLMDCTKCGHEISKTAKKCPNCGSKMSDQRTSAFTWIVAIVFGFSLFFILSPDTFTSASNLFSGKSTTASDFISDKSTTASDFISDKSTAASDFISDKSTTASNYISDKLTTASDFISDKLTSSSTSKPTSPTLTTNTTSKPLTTNTTSKPAANWNYWVSKDEFTHEDVHHANFKTNDSGLNEVQPWVICRSKDKELEIFFEVGELISSGDFRPQGVKVEYHFDLEPIETANFGTSTGFSASSGRNYLLLPTYMYSEFVTGLTNGSKLQFRLYNYQGSQHDAEIPLRGNSAVISKVLQACS